MTDKIEFTINPEKILIERGMGETKVTINLQDYLIYDSIENFVKEAVQDRLDIKIKNVINEYFKTERGNKILHEVIANCLHKHDFEKQIADKVSNNYVLASMLLNNDSLLQAIEDRIKTIDDKKIAKLVLKDWNNYINDE